MTHPLPSRARAPPQGCAAIVTTCLQKTGASTPPVPSSVAGSLRGILYHTLLLSCKNTAARANVLHPSSLPPSPDARLLPGTAFLAGLLPSHVGAGAEHRAPPRAARPPGRASPPPQGGAPSFPKFHPLGGKRETKCHFTRCSQGDAQIRPETGKRAWKRGP